VASLGLAWQGAANFSDIEIDHRYRLLVGAVSDYAIFMPDASGYVTSLNLGAQRIKGFTSDEIIGRHFSVFYTKEDLAAGKPVDLLCTAATTGRAQDEGWRVRKDGSQFWADVTITAVRKHDGTLLGYAKITQDLTARHRLSELEGSASTAALVQQARENEKKRIARELHDDLGQQIVAVQMTLALLKADMSSASTERAGAAQAEALDDINHRLENMTSAVRRIAANLRPALLDDLGLDAAIEWIAQEVEHHHGLRVQCQIDETIGMVDERAAITLYRVVQEALTNTVKHAHAGHVVVDLSTNTQGYQLRIQDDGVGFAPEVAPRQDAFGLLGMRERILQRGGSLQIDSHPDAGVCIVASLPFSASEEAVPAR